MMRRVVTVSIVGIMLLATVFAAASPAYANGGVTLLEKLCKNVWGGVYDPDFKTCLVDYSPLGLSCPGDQEETVAYINDFVGLIVCRAAGGAENLDYGGSATASNGNCGVFVANSTLDGTVSVRKMAPPVFAGFVQPTGTGYKQIKEYVGVCRVLYYDAEGNALADFSSYAQVFFNLNSNTRNLYDNGALLLMIWNGSGWEDCGATLVDAGEFGRLACGTSYHTFGLARQ